LDKHQEDIEKAIKPNSQSKIQEQDKKEKENKTDLL
jgi:hypothetical protein